VPQLTDSRVDSHFNVNEDTWILQTLDDVSPPDELTMAFYQKD